MKRKMVKAGIGGFVMAVAALFLLFGSWWFTLVQLESWHDRQHAEGQDD